MDGQRFIVTGVLALALASLTLGQDGIAAPDDGATPPAAPGDPEASAAPTDEEDGERPVVRLPPVVVTARKWTEETRDVPQSITVVPESLVRDAGLRRIRDAAIFVPNLRMTEFTSRRLSFPFLRGIGSGQGDPAVTTYLDGVPQLDIGGTNLPLLDVERIEFLRGPQGTLYGRNSIGGIINVITRRPSNTQEIEGEATFGNYGLRELRALYSGPLVEDRLFMSVAGLYLNRDGYTTNDLTGNDVDDRDTLFGRGQLLWTPDEKNEILFTIHGERTRDGGFVLSDLQGLRERPFHIAQDFEGVTERDVLSPALTWTHYGAAIDLTSISAFQRSDVHETSDFDFTALDGVRRRTDESFDGYSQELRISSAEDVPLEIGDGAEVKWLLGAFVFGSDSDRSAANELRPGGVGILFPVPGTDTSRGDFDDLGVAAFGQVTLTLNEALDLTAGLRYDYESKDADLDRTFETGGFPVSSVSQDLDESYDEWVPRFGAAFRWTDEVTLYGLAAKGFQAGGFNLSAPSGEVAYAPETSWTYEAGVKTAFLDERLLINAAYFHVDWDDMQLSQFDAMSGGYVTNAGESTSQGVELDVTARPIEGLDLFAAFGYTDTEFDSFVDSFSVDVSGNDLPFAPETTWSVGAQLSGDLGRSTQFYLRGEYVSVGRFFYDAGNLEDERHETANFRAGLGGHNWRLEAWVRNAFDDEYVPVAFQPSPVDPAIFVGENGAPRTYGVTFSFRF